MYAHLKSRWLNLALYSGVTVTDRDVTFLLWNMSGQLCGYQTYNPAFPKVHTQNPHNAKYYSWIAPGKPAVWGLETLHTLDTSTVYLTEGIFDACRLHWNGYAAIALLGNNPKHLKNWLNLLPFNTCACVQGDAAGKKLAKFGRRAMYLPADNDIGDLTNAQFIAMVKLE